MRPLPVYTTPFLNCAQIKSLAATYMDKESEFDRIAMNAGKRILEGDLSEDNIREIYVWKLQSFYKRFQWVRDFPAPNTLEEVRYALEGALTANGEKGPKAAVNRLIALKFVGIPVASAILTAIYPKSFTIIDRQAYKTLKQKTFPSMTIDEYLHYLNYCRNEAVRWEVSLRDFDRALWQAGSDSGKKPKSSYCV